MLRIILAVGLAAALLAPAGCGPKMTGRPYKELKRKSLSREDVFRRTSKGRVTHALTEGGPPVIRDLDDGRDMLVIINGVKLVLPMREKSPARIWDNKR